MSSHHHDRPSIPNADQLAALPRDGGEGWNRLVFEQSPYLLQHAANPVDWFPWGDEAFEAARRLDKPVFLSIGYATCHWCHVMERETFENPAIAALLNEAFVCVKVDREERPDIDHVYMTVTQALTGSGGWPMTVVLTPDRKPFFAGTYFPPDSRYGRPGVPDLVNHLTSIWKTDRQRALDAADSIAGELGKMTASFPGGAPDEGLLQENFLALEDRFEPRFGGFSQRPKFPVPHNLSFLLRHHRRSGSAAALAMAEKTLHHMRHGGVFDQVGLGIHRYATDTEWLVPHFEKMLYDQALTTIAAVEAWQHTGHTAHRAMAEDILAYVLRDMTAPEGGFYSAEDADSEGEEGKFYTWSVDEVIAVLGSEEGQLYCEVYQFERRGNFREESTGELMGVNIPHLARSLDDEARARGMAPEALRARLETSRQKLFAVREQRIHPLKDDKVLTDWNGLMIAALAKAGRAMESAVYTTAAKRAAGFILAHLRTPEGRLLKRWRQGNAGLPAHLEDYAFLAWGLIELYEATFAERWLLAAGDLIEVLIARFFDETNGGFFQTADDGEALIVRSKEVYDGALPSGNSVAALALLKYARMMGDARVEDYAHRTLRAFSAAVLKAPGNFSMYLQAAALAVGPSHEIVLAGDAADPTLQAMAAAARRQFLPGAVLVHRPADDTSPILGRSEMLRAQAPQSGRATAYICRNFACDQPVSDMAAFEASLARILSAPVP